MQPIAFPHPTHVQTLGMNCLYCHFSANKSPDPGIPAVSTCMGCHLIVGPSRPAMNGRPARTSAGIQTLQNYWNKKQAIPWQRIHKVPDYVNFPHMRHVTFGVTCQPCHGPVQNMTRVFQYSSLNMGWCVNCHVGNVNKDWKARTTAPPATTRTPRMTEPEKPAGVRRRDFLKVLGVVGAGATAACTDRTRTSSSPISSPPTRPSPASPTTTRPPAANARPAAACSWRRATAAPSSSKGIPAHPVNRGALCARGQSGGAGALQSGSLPEAEGEGERRASADVSWDAAITLLVAKLGDAGRRGSSATRCSSTSTRPAASRAFLDALARRLRHAART